MKGKIYNLDSVVPWAIRQGFPVSYVMEQEEIPFADPRLFGKEGYVGAQSPPHITLSTTPYIAELDDVIIYNKSNLIIKGNTALDDVAAHPTYGKYVDLMHDKTVLDQKDKQVHLYHDTYDLYDFKSCGIFLSGLASGYFGHWGPEFLAKLQVLEHHKDYKDLPIIVDRDMPQSHFDYLSCITQNDLVKLPPHTGLLCTKLLVAPTNVFFPSFLVNENKVPHQDMALSPRTLLFLRERVLSKIQGHSRFGKKIYISRRHQKLRKLINEDEIIKFMINLGFEIVEPETLSFADQVLMFMHAEYIVAPYSSALLNIIFSQTNIKLFILIQSRLYNFGSYYGALQALGYDMLFVTGEAEIDYKHASFHVPIERLSEALAIYA